MHDIFINFRSDDTAGIATLLDRELSRRFGLESLFFAPRSIEAGQRFSEAILTAVRQSGALLALIGPYWLAGRSADGRGLHNEWDWVRREIIEALISQVRVIPVLVGRKTPSLRPSDLPEELAILAKFQHRRLDPNDPGPGLTRIGDDLAKLFPHLPNHDASEAQPNRHPPQTGTIVYRPTGPVHTGSGNQHNTFPTTGSHERG
ncbi:toll/interleukin-1 receptor domain-containing protein [Nonomuraea mesophila]|uniref:Toll/interleukin-1 receptor domain-containing protein n=1 Tax=Nonomuraea mesophila TaxID=2530382 RepID=A0A4R5EV35_9ACTN|nr:TIR domain-containing protein [Nonomuraea mesophila]TDE38818.1 toll/interleukin-1 receptor domain-containing protein [Nonomuraea mesophila]